MESSSGWATEPQDTRERTCECPLGPFRVRHTLRLARNPDGRSVTVTRTHEVTVEWYADTGLDDWLSTVATHLAEYGDRDPTDPAGDGRFRAEPVDATVVPATVGPLDDTYHFWNTPLARLQRDEGYPDEVRSLTVDLASGPVALWSSDASDDVDGRVGVEVTGRERFQRPVDGEVWSPVGERSVPSLSGLAELAAETVGSADVDSDVAVVAAAVQERVETVSRAFGWSGGEDPYRIPDSAVRTATTVPGG